MKQHSRFFLVVSLAIMAVACSKAKQKKLNSNATITISNAWARSAEQGANSAVYLTITNPTSSTDTLTAVKTAVAHMASVHKTSRGENGMTSMHHVKTVTVKADSKLVLKPGGYHIMLMNLTRNLQQSDTLTLNLVFAQAGQKKVFVPVGTVRSGN